jgi:hypothetical protein
MSCLKKSDRLGWKMGASLGPFYQVQRAIRAAITRIYSAIKVTLVIILIHY